ncbi:hypothetical protein Efla_001758 [Eimeria flavescens]
MKVLEERCDVITNMEVMLLLVQQQQSLPSVDSLLRCASRPPSSSSAANSTASASVSKSASRSGGDPDDGSTGHSESAAERFRLEHVKELLYQHMFNQMVQDYIRKTCPYLHLLRSPLDSAASAERLKTQQGVRNPTRRPPLTGSSVGRRSSGVGGLRHGGLSPLISGRCRECLDVLSHRFGLTDLELLTILNLGAHKLVEIYVFVDDCATRFTEEDAALMLNLINISLVQQQALLPLPEPAAPTAMDVEERGQVHGGSGTPPSELDALRKQQEELQEEARQLQLQRQQAQAASWSGDDGQPATSERQEHSMQDAAPADSVPGVPPSLDLFASPEEAKILVSEEASAQDTPKGAKPRGRGGRTPAAKRRPSSRRKRVLDD